EVENEEENDADADLDAQHPPECMRLGRERNVLEVHAPHAADDNEGESEWGDDGETLGYAAKPVGDLGEIAVECTAQQFAVGVDRVVDPEDVIVDVAEVDLRLGREQRA